jgi:hypothetical protein
MVSYSLKIATANLQKKPEKIVFDFEEHNNSLYCINQL